MQQTPSQFKRILTPKFVVFVLSLPNGTKLEINGILTHESDKQFVVAIPFGKMPHLYNDERLRFVIDNILSRVPDETRDMYSYIQAIVDRSNIIDAMPDDPALNQIVSEMQEELVEIARIEKELRDGFATGAPTTK